MKRLLMLVALWGWALGAHAQVAINALPANTAPSNADVLATQQLPSARNGDGTVQTTIAQIDSTADVMANKNISCTVNTTGSTGPNNLTGLGSECAQFDVTAYGALCNASADDTTAINAAFAAALTAYNVGNYTAVKVVFPPNKRCFVSSSINATGFTNISATLIVEGNGAYLAAINFTGGPIVDALGSLGMIWQDLTVQQTSGTNSYGFQFGRTGITASNGGGSHTKFNNFQVIGSFTNGACYSFSSEEVIWDNVSCINSLTTGGFGLILDGANHWNITSAFVTETAPVDTYQSFGKNEFYLGRYEGFAATGAPVWMQNLGQFAFHNSYLLNQATNGSCIYLYATIGGGGTSNYGLLEGIDFDIHCENLSLKQTFFITGPGTGGANFTATPRLKNIYYRDTYVFAATSVFAIDAAANITGVTINDLHLAIVGGPSSPAFSVFDTPASYTVDGQGYLYNSSIWNGTLGMQMDLDQAGSKTFNAAVLTGQTSISLAGSYTFSQLSAGIFTLPAGTYNDSTSSGTVATSFQVINFGIPTITATSAVTYSGVVATINCAGAPVAGTNVTFPANVWCINAQGGIRTNGNLQVNGSASIGANATLTGNISINNSGTAASTVNINTASGQSGQIMVGNSSNTGKTVLAGLASGTVANGVCVTSGGIVITCANNTLSGTSSSIGGSALLAGACATTTVSITGAATSMVVQATPVTYPGAGNFWQSYVSSANTVTVAVCAAVAGTPGASTYNVRVLQ